MTAKKPGEKSQLDKFRELAREAECEMDEAGLDRAIGAVGSGGPKTEAEAREEEGKAPRGD